MNRQKGNVIPYLLAVLLSVALAAQYVFNAYRLSNEATRLQNTTDAAAYSLANVYAQNHNFVALSNRAMIANHISMAQVVTVMSWSRMLETFAQTVNDIGQYIPWVNAVTGYIESAASTIVSALETAIPQVVRTLGLYNQANANIQRLSVPLVSLIAQEILSDVVTANDEDIDYSMAEVLVANATRAHLREHYGPSDCIELAERVRYTGHLSWSQREIASRCHQFRNVTLASRDGFTEDRTYRFSFPGMPDKLYTPPAEDVGDVQLWSELTIERAGQTTMGGETNSVNRLAPFTSWSAIDTISIHTSTRYLKISWTGVRLKKTRHEERVKLGTGHAYAGPDNNDGHHIIHEPSEAWEVNPRGSSCSDLDYADRKRARNDGRFMLMDVLSLNCNSLARDYSNSLEGRNDVGLLPFRNLRQAGYVEEQSPVLLYLRKDRQDLRLVSDLDPNNTATESIDIERGAADNAYHGAAGAAVYFRRSNDNWMLPGARRGDGRIEFGNSYNPLWEPRLRKMSNSEKAAVRTLTGG